MGNAPKLVLQVSTHKKKNATLPVTLKTLPIHNFLRYLLISPNLESRSQIPKCYICHICQVSNLVEMTSTGQRQGPLLELRLKKGGMAWPILRSRESTRIAVP